MDKLSNSLEKYFFSCYFRETNLQFFYLRELLPHSFLSEKYLDKTDLFLVKTVILYAQYCNYIRFDPLLLQIENEKYYKRSIRGRKFCNF